MQSNTAPNYNFNLPFGKRGNPSDIIGPIRGYLDLLCILQPHLPGMAFFRGFGFLRFLEGDIGTIEFWIFDRFTPAIYQPTEIRVVRHHGLEKQRASAVNPSDPLDDYRSSTRSDHQHIADALIVQIHGYNRIGPQSQCLVGHFLDCQVLCTA